MEKFWMKTKIVTVKHPADRGKVFVMINPYYEVGDRVVVPVYGEAKVVADGGPVVMSSWDAWVEQNVKLMFPNGRTEWLSSGDISPYQDTTDEIEIPF